MLVLNNTKVLPSRFIGNRQGFTGEVEILLLNPVDGEVNYTCMMRPAKKLKVGTIVEIPNSTSLIEVIQNNGGGKGVVKLVCNDVDNAGELMQTYGQMPIPPYLNRDAEELDKTVYQTRIGQFRKNNSHSRLYGRVAHQVATRECSTPR